MKTKFISLLIALLLFPGALLAQQKGSRFDVLIKGGTVYDGSGATPIKADIGIRGDRIIAIGNLRGAQATSVIDASGLAVAPGFINMLSHSEGSLVAAGRSQSEIRQGVTTEIFGEGTSAGARSHTMRKRGPAPHSDHQLRDAGNPLAREL